MSSLKRIYLACRVAIAELNLRNYLLSVSILIGSFILGLLVNNDSNNGVISVLRKEYLFWDPQTLNITIAIAGWISGLIISGTLYNNWFKEENQTIRTLTLPLSNAERFAAMTLLYFVYAPLTTLLPPLLLTMAACMMAPEAFILPAPVYLWEALIIGWLAHAATCIAWLFPSIAYGKKVGFVLVGIIGAVILYLNLTYSTISDVANIPYTATAMLDQSVVGLSDQSFQLSEAPRTTVRVAYDPDQSLYPFAQLVFALMMLAAAYFALTRKTT
ncbi:hypothetical protein FUA23_00465 [Neolewinella aurantiaca]|uniref:ABC-2 type transport system permease protein n=1 Tax=Neolewinella aurantiaca TaxID=2602767 RepID=A0A5C7FXZ4_9BACT|nr:hypothetical protein [Neolewinella aurantiaca]TXF91691.1 hypothetical protein FUA23_00465 [Neolewinella aurantiaca]